MENPEEYKRGLFEENFRKAFEGKEAIPPASVWEKLAWKKSFVGKSKGVNPPPAVWSRIQNELHPVPVRIPFYKSAYTKMAAAAAVMLLVIVFGLNNSDFDLLEERISDNSEVNSIENSTSSIKSEDGVNLDQDNRREGLPSEETITSNIPNDILSDSQSKNLGASSDNSPNIVPQELESLQLATSIESADYDISEKVDQLSEIILANVSENNFESASNGQLNFLDQKLTFEPLANNAKSLGALDTPVKLKTHSEITTLKIPDITPSKLRNPNKGFFTQLSFTTGSFDPNFTMQEGDIINAYALTVNSREAVAVPAQMGVNQLPENSLQVGVGLGYKLGKNLMIESGVQYANHSTTSISNVVASPQHFTWAKPVTVAVTNEERLRPQMEFEITDAYQVRNAFQFISVPLNLGFIIPMKQAEVVLKTGATANVFTGAEIIDPNGRLRTEVFKPGVASPYNTVFVQGMVATELAYKISPSYSLGVQAGYFFAVSDLAKSNLLFSSQPNQYNLGFVMRYNLPRF